MLGVDTSVDDCKKCQLNVRSGCFLPDDTFEISWQPLEDTDHHCAVATTLKLDPYLNSKAMAAQAKSSTKSKGDAAAADKVDQNQNYARTNAAAEELEFGGPIGVTALMVWSHYILFYFWYCLEKNSGAMILPTSIDSLLYHVSEFGSLFQSKGIPSNLTWIAYFIFFTVQLVLAAIMPGLTMEGLPTAPHGIRLKYHCNGYSCYYLCMFLLAALHISGVFPITYLADNFGEFLVASMVIGDLTSLGWYLYGLAVADEYNGRAILTGNVFYDFFMGTILYPRFGEIDIKMVAECRWSWLTLALLTFSCAVKQYETIGYVSSNMWLMVLAHWLYSNATVKGEHCIPPTWDMFHENFGWMLNFWNVCGVPFLYCFQSLYILKNQSSISSNYPVALSVANFVLLIVGYYIFDTANCQKATCKIKIKRNTFPQVPWAILQEPIQYMETPKGKLLVDGWYAFARKMQYTGDIMMAISWGLACGFGSSLPYFYSVFFTSMIVHRQIRDEVRCKAKYGKYWDLYTKQVPNVFFPSAAFYTWLFTGKLPTVEHAAKSS
jgi:delta24(24(1))-sterol reductase